MGRTRLALAAVAAAMAGVAGGAGGLALAATPASAASGPPFATVNPVGDNGVANTPTPTISGTLTPGPGGRITTVQIHISSSHQTSDFVTPASGQNFSAAVPPSQALAWNGPYQVVATATEQEPGGSTQQGQPSPRRDFAEGVPPQPPTGVSATKDANGNAVTVAWQANQEPDIVGYEVQRTSVNNSNWSTVANLSATDTNDRDTSVQQGSDYQYHVIAVRSGAQQGSTISSAPSASASTVAPPAGSLFGPGGSVAQLPAAIQAITDPVAGLVHPGQGPGGPVTGSPTAGGYSNLPYGGQAALTEPGTPGAQDPKGKPAGANIVKTALFVAAALILLAIAAHLFRMRRAVDETLAPVGVDQWDRHSAGVDETGQMTTVGSGRGGSDVTRAMPAQQGGAGRSDVTRAMAAHRRR